MMAAHTATRIPITSPLPSAQHIPSFQHHHQYTSPHHPSVYYPAGVHQQQQQYYQPATASRSASSDIVRQEMEYGADTASLSAAKVKSSAAKRASAKAAAATKKAQAAAAAAAAAGSGNTSSDEDASNESDTRKKTVIAATSSAKGRPGSASARASQGASPTPAPDAKGDWVVPQRAKPGRKPSQEEPLTKRQAQNRASQRAFRERKQSHVATLEAKVAAFEAEKLTRDAKEQENHRKLVQENQSLKGTNATLTNDNTALKSRVQELEAALEQMRLGGGTSMAIAGPSYLPAAVASTSTWTPCYDAGCRAPMHEQHIPPAQRRKRPLPSRVYEDQSGGAGMAGDHSTTTSRFGAMSIAAGSPPEDLTTTPSRGGAFGARDPFAGDSGEDDGMGSGPLAYLSTSNKHRDTNGLTSPEFMPTSGGCGGGDMDMDRDCGFCTDATPCLCRGDAILDLTGMDEDDAREKQGGAFGVTAGVDRMIKIEEEDGEDEKVTGDVHMGDTSSRLKPMGAAAIAIPSLLSSRPRDSKKPKLWSVVSASTKTDGEAKSSTAASASKKNKLWWTRPASAQTYSTPSVTSFVPPGEKQLNEQVYVTQSGSAPTRTAWDRRNSLVAAGATQAEIEAALCSGDPSNCPACATDPALAAFCEAVGEGEDDGASAKGSTSDAISVGPSVTLPPRPTTEARPPLPQSNSATGYAIPLSTTYRPRSTSTNTIPTLRSLDLDLSTSPTGAGALSPTTRRNRRLQAAGYSIPDAFRQIRAHPGFPQWQGGLNLLADVVSGRGGNGSVHVTQPRKVTGLTESTDRSVMHDEEEEQDDSSSTRLPSLLRSSSAARTETLSSSVPTSNATQGSSHLKRRRLYVENDRVQEALRMLDFGAISGGASSTASARKLPLPLPRAPPSSLAYGGNGIAGTESAERRGAPCMECPCPCPWAQGGSAEGEQHDSSSQDESK